MVIKKMDNTKSYGFIEAEKDKKQYFFHKKNCITRFDEIQLFDLINFNLKEMFGRIRAIDVEKVEDSEHELSKTREGVINRIDYERRFAILGVDGTNVFLHVRNFIDDFFKLKVGSVVEFKTELTKKGYNAINGKLKGNEKIYLQESKMGVPM